MINTRVKIQSILESQIPAFLREESPQFVNFLTEYYNSAESRGLPLDLLNNIDQYVKIDNIAELTYSTILEEDLEFNTETIVVSSTSGFPENNGLIQIDNEIILYKSKTDFEFKECARGFSGITTFRSYDQDQLLFSSTSSELHSKNTVVYNLSNLFLKEFYRKFKYQFASGFSDTDFYEQINDKLLVSHLKDFYSSKGTSKSFEILFKALYGKEIKIIRPRDYVLQSSDGDYRITKDLVVEIISGNPQDLINKTLYQDSTAYNEKSYGSVTKVEEIYRNNNYYYQISLDYNPDIEFSNFVIHPKTTLLSSTVLDQTYLDVDSTLGFQDSGILVVVDNEINYNISYKSKSTTQFFGCENVIPLNRGAEILTDNYAYGYSNSGEQIKVRVTGVLSDIENIPENTFYCEPEDDLTMISLGSNKNTVLENSWVVNISPSYTVKSVSFLSNNRYRITTLDNNIMVPGDLVTLTSNTNDEYDCIVINVANLNIFDVSISENISVDKKYIVRRNIKKVVSENITNLNDISSDVQNLYNDVNSDNVTVASPSFPSYLNTPLNIKYFTFNINGFFDGEELEIGEHPFLTGDSVYYKSASDTNKLNIIDGTYFVKKISSSKIKLSTSRSNIYNNIFIYIVGDIANNTLTLDKFSNKSLKSQNLIRKIQNPINKNTFVKTSPGQIGIFCNGVEILNYKSTDVINYGELQRVEISLVGNDDYDIINPPILNIDDPVGYGATGVCHVTGSLKRIEIIDPGFDFVIDPIVSITGGNGSGSNVVCKTIPRRNIAEFSAYSQANLINLNNNTIGFATFHRFVQNESVIYSANNQNVISGLIDNNIYYVSIIDSNRVRLHYTENDAISGINTVGISSYSSGIHKLETTNFRKVLGSIEVIDGGSGYTNKKLFFNPEDVNLYNQSIKILHHGYINKEIVVYETTGSVIGGLSTTSSYYVTTVDENNIKLSPIGIGTVLNDYYYINKSYINFSDIGSGVHSLNYPPIKVEIKSPVGISTSTQQDFSAKIQPIFRGTITSVSLSNKGQDYGDQEIINYDRQPLCTLINGSDAILTPVISDGKITEVLINNPGVNYNSPPTLTVDGDGNGCKLTPVMNLNGGIDKVIINYNGRNYNSANTSIIVSPAGEGTKFYTKIKSWTINLVERNILSNQISSDDGIVYNGINQKYELQYCHAYAPRKLREILLSNNISETGSTIYRSDLLNDTELKKYHSPIIGWSYDGNPIYGPYGYDNPEGGTVKRIESGYSLISNPSRPSSYPSGFFIEDYEYTGLGDLDESNGRFCKTPEFPKGTYAYFTTLESKLESTGIFRNSLRPKFPYVIGSYFKSTPISFNFDKDSNQEYIDLNNSNLLRNTNKYSLLSDNSYYDGFIRSDKLQKSYSKIKASSSGFVDGVKIIFSGNDYNIKDFGAFDNTDTNGSGAFVRVSEIKGKTVTEISNQYAEFPNVEFLPSKDINLSGMYIGICSEPHGLESSEIVQIQNLNDRNSTIEGSFYVGITSNILTLNEYINSVSITGLVTYFNVSGNLSYPNIQVNDVLGIGTEQLKVLNIDPESSRIRVLRNHNSTIGIAYTNGTEIVELPRKFFLRSGIETSSYFSNINKQIYFNPSDTFGISTSVGIGTTIVFSNPGTGMTSLFVPYGFLYLPNHGLENNDIISYNNNGNSSISVSIGSTTLPIQNGSDFYVAKVSNDLIGISTVKIGIGTTGTFIGLSTSNTNILYSFSNFGSGLNHSFITKFPNVLVGDVYKNTALVTTSEPHLLEGGNYISIEVITGIQTSVVVKYNDSIRRMVVDPLDFTNLDVNLPNNTITIPNHNYIEYQKVVHTSNSPSSGLENNEIYYVVIIDRNTIQLTKDYINNYPEIINITSASYGTLSKINPYINVFKNNTIVFDLSDSSLGYNSLPAFDFDLYNDTNFTDKFYTTGLADTFNVQKIGNIGSPGARVILTCDDILDKLYYNLTPIRYESLPPSKRDIVVDNFNNINNNTIKFSLSLYSGSYPVVTGIGSTSFKYPLIYTPEKAYYSSNESSIEYSTNAVYPTSGPIHNVKLESGGRGYKKLPSFSYINSISGSDAIFLPSSNTIGKPEEFLISDIGFDFPSDLSLRPSFNYPTTFKINPLSIFDSIRIISPGSNYYLPPKLIVIDGFTGEVRDEVDIKYNIGDTEVSIVRNTNGIYNAIPRILPTNNPNGIRISNISYNNVTSIVTITLATSYSSEEDFPFIVGDKILVENTNIVIPNDGELGYNSANYGYKLFELTEVNPNIGLDNPTIKYSLSGYADPGTFDNFESFGSVIPEKYFPTFSIQLKKSTYIKNELVNANSTKFGRVLSYNDKTEYLRVSSVDDFKVGELLIGESSKTSGIIGEIYSSSSTFKVSSNSITKKGWEKQTGLLNDDLQRLHDNDYYQYFSYSIKSPISYEVWNSTVSNLNHTSGFKKFSNLDIDSSYSVGIQTEQNFGEFETISDIYREVNLNLVHDFDLTREKSILVNNTYVSNELIFDLPFLQKYQEFIGNRVIKIDNISSQFDGIKKSFELYSNNYSIFNLPFDASDPNRVLIFEDSIFFNNHYFVNGEELEYIPHNNNPANSIQIGATTIPGIGLTNRLPSKVYVIKIDNQKIQLAATAENSLLFIPIPLNLSAVGIGSSHILRSKNQTTRALISINNVIQSPIVSTAVTSSLVSSVGIGTTIFRLSGISSIFGGDLLKINNEIVKINSVGIGSTNYIQVARASMGTTESSHSANSLVTKLSGNYNITDNTLSFSEPILGPSPIGTTTNSPSEVDYSGITTFTTFDGRVFLRSALDQNYTTNYVKAYDTNYVFDDISQKFNGITTQFSLKSNGTNITGISTGNALILIDDVVQGPQRIGNPLTDINGDFKLSENSGITTISFTGNISYFNTTKDQNVANIPKGGSIISVGSTNGQRYQPLVAAAGTAIVSVSGTIQSISIGNSGSGYRVGIQTIINVGIQTYNANASRIINIGYANVSGGRISNVVITNPGSGYTSSNPPKVVIDSPLSYMNIPLIYSSSSPSGIGTGATIDIVVGQGSSVINFELNNPGYGYGQGDILTVPFGGTTGIPTDSSTFTLYPFKEFQLYVDRTFNSKFSGWSFGDLLVLDNIESYFNGVRKIFPLSRNGERISFYPRRSSGIRIDYNLLIFVNDILQVPEESYSFNGGSVIRFTEAPKGSTPGYPNSGDKCKIMMYTGTQSIDVQEIDVIPSIKIGDDVKVYSDYDQTLNQNERLVVDISSADSIITNNYADQGVTNDQLLKRPIEWIKQTVDKIIDQVEVGKDRVYYEPLINPVTNILSSVGIGSTFVFVTSAKTFFDNIDENVSTDKTSIIEIVDQTNLIPSTAYSTVSIAGTISSITLSNPGYGYTIAPSISIQSPGIGTTARAYATSSITNGIVTSISVTNGGSNYFDGPLNSLSVYQEGLGYPSITGLTNKFVNARLKTLSGSGVKGVATIEINTQSLKVSSIQVIDGGSGYKVGDLVYLDIFDNVGLATTTRRSALSRDLIFQVTSVQSPLVLIDPPFRKTETIKNVTYEGDYGQIVGVGTTNSGTIGITFDFYIPQSSNLYTRYGTYKTGIQTGYYFIVENSSVGYGITSLKSNNSLLSVGSTCLDNTYEVFSTRSIQKFIPSVGLTTVTRVTAKVSSLNGFVGIATTSYYGNYSWGKINIPVRISPVGFNTTTTRYSGISTNPIIRRRNPLNYIGYST
jgi:hypothetical protein